MAKTKLIDAATVMQATYNGANGAEVAIRLDVRGVQATYLKSGVLVIPGTNELADWFDFNFNVSDGSNQTFGFEVVPGDSGAMWHAGFLEHAQMVYAFAKPLKPKLIIGHSLGAASAQIVGMSLKTPTIAFASPRVLRRVEPITGEGWVVNICRVDDSVCYVPPPILGFRHVGSRYWLTTDEIHEGEDHRIDKYITLMGRKAVADRLPATWPV